ncbi:DUF368 domain-containing protein [Streptomonospora litoralis]|uniref:DUF368 domain-containing protein n=1 Tax=Streptomonospora litoralis TaxID=2498135 RepID=A0A4P6Q1T3_9ACTN|nr:DUF368 domain-containing protein [Streptomonospora litoralis]QBI53201.1 hypothetical protein EKD16_07025 [Streptomonospora litoralis]
MAKTVGTHIVNVVRGALIGTAEAVPGVSGGTIALIVGIYTTLITSAGHAVSGVRLGAVDVVKGRGLLRARTEFAKADWPAVIAVLVGMVCAALLAASFLAPVVEAEEQLSYAFFFGLVLASLWVPYTASGRSWKAGHYLLALAAAAAAFVLTGLPPAHVEPNPLIIMAAAAVAICALVLPGVSGSFILLTLGLYTSTMSAVSERDFGYLGLFLAGAVIGLAFFVKLLQLLLERHHHITLVVLTGLLAGSLRALWPWQDEDRTLLAPEGDVAVTTALMAGGFATVVAVILIERAVRARTGASDGQGTAPDSAPASGPGGRM